MGANGFYGTIVAQRSTGYVLAGNHRTSDLATYDQEQLTALLGELAITEAGLVGTGYSADDLMALASKPQRRDDCDPDDMPEAPEEPISKPGDVWSLGDHRLVVGDPTDVAAVEAMLDGDRADCMWTDPPYGVSYVGKTKTP